LLNLAAEILAQALHRSRRRLDRNYEPRPEVECRTGKYAYVGATVEHHVAWFYDDVVTSVDFQPLLGKREVKKPVARMSPVSAHRSLHELESLGILLDHLASGTDLFPGARHFHQ